MLIGKDTNKLKDTSDRIFWYFKTYEGVSKSFWTESITK